MLILGVTSILIVGYFVREWMRSDIEDQIQSEALSIQSNTELYVRQILLINNCQINEDSFRKCMNDIIVQLKKAGEYEVALYDMDGEVLQRSDKNRFSGEDKRADFQRAKNKESAFTVNYGREETCEVYLTMPVQVMNQDIGIISYYMDYNSVYHQKWNSIQSILRITVLAFGIIFVLIWIMISRMVKPIRDLSRVSSAMSRWLKEGKKNDGMEADFQYCERKDEIGELSRNYVQMLRVTEEQFAKIQEDRDHILMLWNSRQEFYNNVTHELKTPLTTISGYAQLIEENGLNDEELFYNGMEHILQESTRLHRMVVQLLEMQNKESIAGVRPLNVTDLLKDVIDAMQMKAGRYENRLLLKGAGTYMIEGREDRIRQVFINLIDNAIKYGEPKKDIVISIAAKARMVRIAVINKGDGMDEEELSHIFEPFYRVDKEHSRELGSSGLGLAITKKIMEEHGGSIEAECSPDGYIIFKVYFPLMQKVRRKE